MLLLKISYAAAFLSAAICAVFAISEGEPVYFGLALSAFITGSVIAGLDRIITLMTPVSERPTEGAILTEGDKPAAEKVAPNPDELDRRIAAAKSRYSV